MASHYLRKYGVAATLDFELYELDGTDLIATAASASGDVTLNRDEGNQETLDADAFVDEGQTYSLVLSIAEMTASRIIVHIVDQSNPKIWLDKVLIVETYGHASAQHPFDLGTATVNLSSTTETQIDAIETDTNEIQGKLPTNKIMGSSVVTDKDDEIDAIKAKTDSLPTDPADESNIIAEINANEAKIDIIDTIVDAIKAKTDNLPTDPADESLLEAEINANEVKIDALQVDVTAIKGYVDTEVAAIKAVTDTLTLAAISDAVHDETTETGITHRKAINIILAALAGKSSGGGTNNIKFRDQADTKDRIDATVDADGNRTAITNDGA